MTRLFVPALAAALCLAAPGCSTGGQTREEALAANQARLDERMAAIAAEYEARAALVRTEADRQALTDWQRRAYTDALNEYNAEALRIFNRKR